MATKKKTPRKKIAAARKPAARAKVKSKSVASKGTTPGKSRKTAFKAKSAKSLPKSSTSRKSTAASTLRPVSRGASTKSTKGSAVLEKVRVIRSGFASRGEGQPIETINLDVNGLDSRSGGQSGALQGLSDVESADSESVDELLEEGNSYEAGIVKGVQDAPDADAEEVHTHERPQEKDLDEDFREN
jgi:hypothetical protein